MKFISPVLKRIVYPCLSSVGYLSAKSRPGLAVITYHGVLPSGYRPIDSTFDGSLITADAFRAQLRLLKKHYTVISPDEMRRWCREGGELPPRAVLLTCDDGLLNNLTEMLPILVEEGLRCLFFVTGASFGKQRTMLWYENLLLLFLRARAGHFSIAAGDLTISGSLDTGAQRRRVWWATVVRLSATTAQNRQDFLDAACSYFGLEDSISFYKSYPEAERHFCLLTEDETKKLHASSMTIGAHTVTHPILSEQPPELAWSEMAESKSRLETVLGESVWALAYPFGFSDSVNPSIVAMAKRVGFDAAFTNIGGGLGAPLPVYEIPRVHVSARMSLAEFESHVSGFYEGLRRAVGVSLERRPGENGVRREAAVEPSRLSFHAQD